MDLSDPFKAETLRPLATLFLPGAVAISPYVIVATHYVSAIDDFASANTGIYVVLLALAALSMGFVLEDMGSRVEGLVWDRLVEKETGVHTSDWYAFLNLAPASEKIGHRYLRTITLHLKFELAFSLALLLLWFGMLWLDSIVLLWSYDSAVLFSAVILSLASYILWESYSSVWVLARLRHLIVKDVVCEMEGRSEDGEEVRRAYDWMLLIGVALAAVWSTLLVTHAISEEHRGGLFLGFLIAAFSATQLLALWWLRTEKEAVGRRRGIALRFALAFSLLAALVQLRRMTADFPLGATTFWAAIIIGGAHLAFANRLWAGKRGIPAPRAKVASPLTNAAA
jgi:hypothetical protein